MENFPISLQDIINNEGLIFNVRKTLKGKYDLEGLALDPIAKKESVAQYQIAINALDAERQITPDLLPIVGVGGSFAKGKLRFGVFDATDFSRLYDKVWELINMQSPVRFTLPSDLDVIIGLKGIQKLSELDQIARKLYRTTGVFIDFQHDIYAGRQLHPPVVPFKSLINGGVVKFFQGHLFPDTGSV